ncbi:MAG: hypothetical protein AB1546_14165 [bacterium]
MKKRKNNIFFMSSFFNLLLISACIIVVSVCSGCGGGGGGGGGTTPPPPNSSTLFLYVNNPETNNKIYTTNSINVTGQTSPGAVVTVNNLAASLDSSGNFTYANLSIASNPFTITVKTTKDSSDYTVTRVVYYQNSSQCTLVYSATDPNTGYTRIYDTDPNIPNSSRCISDSVIGATDTQPALNPSRNTVIFVRTLSGNQNLYSISCTGSGTECPAAGSASQLTSTTGITYQSPSWSKSGSYIAYAASVLGDYDIYTVTSAGQNLTQITTHAAADISPTWSTGDSTIYFASNRPTDGSGGTINYYHLWYVNVSPVGTPTLLTSEPTCPDGTGKCSLLSPDISPNGYLVYQFASSCGTGGGSGTPPVNPKSTCNNLYYMTSYPSGVSSPATSGSNLFLSPHWRQSTTSNELVFVNRNNNTDALYKITFTGTSPGTSAAMNLTGGTPDW